MKLTDDERRLLDGDAGRAAGKAMEILAALGEIYDAEHLVPVRSAQVAGVSYANLGDAGLELLEDWAEDGRVACPTTLNPAGMDLVAWREMGVDEAFAERQLRVVSAYERMGITASCTCTPYLAGNRPAPGEHLAWSESSAVTFANSALGARTNREGGPSALAAALCGRTPAYGLHLDGPRAPCVVVRVEAPLTCAADWGTLGAALGPVLGERVPLLTGLPPAAEEDLMALSAALPTFAGPPLFHVAGVTPEAGRFARPVEELAIGRRELEAARAGLDDGVTDPDLVFVGCPHATLGTVRRVAARVSGRRVVGTLWVATSRAVFERAAVEGLVGVIAGAGGRVVADTCLAVAPLRGRFARVVTDSAKGCYYARGPNAMAVRLASLDECLSIALGEGVG